MLARLNTEASGGTSTKLLNFLKVEEANLLAFLEWALEEKRYALLNALAELEHAIETNSTKGFTHIAALCRDTLPITKGRGEVQGHIFLLAALARCEQESGHRNRALSLLAEAYELAWERKNFPGLFCSLPFVLEAALADSNLELVGELVGFLSASRHAGSWVRRRTERALQVRKFDIDAEEFKAPFERGRQLELRQVMQKVLLFTNQDQTPHTS